MPDMLYNPEINQALRILIAAAIGYYLYEFYSLVWQYIKYQVKNPGE